MKKSAALSEKIISLWEKIHIWDSNHHSSQGDENRKEITMEEIYDILGSPDYVSLASEGENKKKHPQINMSNADPSVKEEIDKYLVLIKTEIKEGREHRTVTINQDSYIKRVEAKSREYGLEIGKHIFIETNPGKIHISETNSTYHTKYKITVKKLNIKVGISSFQMFFDDMLGKVNPKGHPPESNLVKDSYNGGTYLIFEDNLFVSIAPIRINAYFNFSLGNNMYLIFRENIFKSVDIYLSAKGNSIIELTDNHFDNRHVTIGASSHSDGQRYQSAHGAYYDSGKAMATRRMEEWVNDSRKIGNIGFSEFIGNIENKIKQEDGEVNNKDILSMLLYMDKKIAVNPDDLKLTKTESLVRLTSNVIFKLNINNAIYYFKGINIINNLEMSKNITHLYWGAYQDIDPNKDYPYAHKQVFIDFIERAVENNDKIQEARLRKELLKCERAITLQETRKDSWQDRIILGWSSLVSDYGTSWVRPLLLLAIINFLFAAVVVAFFLEPKYSWWFMSTEFKPEFSWYLFLADWSVLFFQFFNPLSNLSDVTGIKNNGWISFIHVFQKGFLAAFLYEIIKIFRRFSK